MASADAARFVLVQNRWAQNPAFAVYDEILTAVADALREQSAIVQIVPSLAEAATVHADAVLLLGTLPYFADWRRELTRLRNASANRPVVFLWQLELLPAPDSALVLWHLHRAKGFREVGKQGDGFLNTRGANLWAAQSAWRAGLLDAVWADTEGRVASLKRVGIPARFLAVGHHRSWGDLEATEQTRDIDVLYLGGLGGLSGRREQILQATKSELVQQEIALQASGDVAPTYLWGEERNHLIRRARVYLCVYRHPGEWSGTRFTLGMANGALVVSEPVQNPAPFVSGEHFVPCEPGRFAETIRAYLADDTERKRICDNARQMLRTEFSMRRSAHRLLEAVQEKGR